MELLKNPLVTSFLGAIIGFLAKTFISYLKQVRLSQEAARLSFLKEQLSEFYWPLYSHLLRDKAVWEIRDENEELDEETRLKIQKEIEEKILLPNHKEMVEIISKKLHLGNYIEVPEIYEAYLKHVAAFQALRAAGQMIPPSAIGAPWPTGITAEVENRVKELTKEYAELLRMTTNKKS